MLYLTPQVNFVPKASPKLFEIFFTDHTESESDLKTNSVYTSVIPIGEYPYLITEEHNPAPGVCLPVIVTFCQQHKVTQLYWISLFFIGASEQHIEI